MRSHVVKNRSFWNRSSDAYQRTHGEQLRNPKAWGVWEIPEAALGILGDVRGKRVLELGCGGAQWSAFLARDGGRLVGLDISESQLRHAREFLNEMQAQVPLVHADAERLPFADASFDIVFCDHGAVSFTDPHHTVPEAARVLAPGGRLAFNMSSPIHGLCWDAAADRIVDRLQRPYFGTHRLEDENEVDFNLPYGDWIRLFRSCRLAVENLVELRPPQSAETTYEGYAPLEWARQWPAENVWVLRKEQNS
jgi:SAM-dependent methyltransferase